MVSGFCTHGNYFTNTVGVVVEIDDSLATPDIAYKRDRLGNVLSAVAEGVSTNLYAYSREGLLTNEVQNGVALSRPHDALGRPLGYACRSADEEGETLSSPEPGDQITRLSAQVGTGAEDIRDNPSPLPALSPSAREAVSTASGFRRDSGFSPRSGQAVHQGEGVPYGVEYTYDAYGRLSAVSLEEGGASPPGEPFSFTYSYLPGTVVAHQEYDPFGNAVVSSGDTDFFSHWFSTKPWCGVTGMVEYQFRKYRPGMGRWMSRDPIGEIGGENLFLYCGNCPIDAHDFLGLKTCYRWMLITFYSGQPPKEGRASYQKADLTENDAAVGLTNWTNVNGRVSKVRDAKGTSDWAYSVYTKFIVHRRTKSGKTTDARTVRDSGKGWAKPRKNLPEGVAVDEWLDLWMKNPTKSTNLGTEIDLVEYEMEEGCDCPEGWSEDNSPPIPENLQKIISGGETENTGVKVNYPTWWPAQSGQ